MLSQLFIDVCQWVIVVALVLVTLKQLKGLFITYSGTVGKATDDGETLNLNVNFTVWDTPKTMAKKLGILWVLGEDRKKWHIKRYKEIFDKAEQEKADELEAKKLKPVG